MAEEQTQGTKQDASARTKRPGLLRFLLWELPWHVVGILLASLLFSIARRKLRDRSVKT